MQRLGPTKRKKRKSSECVDCFESNNALKIWDGTYQKSLEDSSLLIKTLMKSEESSLIIYPKIIKSEITNQISVLKNNT